MLCVIVGNAIDWNWESGDVVDAIYTLTIGTRTRAINAGG